MLHMQRSSQMSHGLLRLGVPVMLALSSSRC